MDCKMKIFIGLLFGLFAVAYCYSQSQDEQYEQMMKAMSPGKEHQVFGEFVGKWKQNILRYSEGGEIPGSGKCENNIIFGGRYLQIDFLQSYDNYTMKGIIYIGYDNILKSYTLFALDELSTSSFFAKGEYNKKENKLVFKGEIADQIKLSYSTASIVFTKDRENKFTIEQFIERNGKTEKIMTIQNILISEE